MPWITFRIPEARTAMSLSLAAFRMHTVAWTNEKKVKSESTLSQPWINPESNLSQSSGLILAKLQSILSRYSPSNPLSTLHHLFQFAQLLAHGFWSPPTNGLDRNRGHTLGWDTPRTLLLHPLQQWGRKNERENKKVGVIQTRFLCTTNSF